MLHEFTAHSAPAPFQWAKVLMMEHIDDYTIEHFSPKFGKTSFHIYADLTKEEAGVLQRKFNILYHSVNSDKPLSPRGKEL